MQLEVKKLRITPKAWEAYQKRMKDESVQIWMLRDALIGVVVRQMADKSPFWLYEHGDIRYVFVVQRGTDKIWGVMALVNVQDRIKAW